MFPPERPRLTMCIIVRDEDQMVRECLASISPLVDESITTIKHSARPKKEILQAHEAGEVALEHNCCLIE